MDGKAESAIFTVNEVTLKLPHQLSFRLRQTPSLYSLFLSLFSLSLSLSEWCHPIHRQRRLCDVWLRLLRTYRSLRHSFDALTISGSACLLDTKVQVDSEVFHLWQGDSNEMNVAILTTLCVILFLFSSFSFFFSLSLYDDSPSFPSSQDLIS